MTIKVKSFDSQIQRYFNYKMNVNTFKKICTYKKSVMVSLSWLTSHQS